MFSHRGLFLAVTISLASIALAGVLVQPGYEHQYDSNSRYSASTESSKSEIIAHDNDVPAKSSLSDAKHPAITTIDSLLLADTNDKLLEKCQAVTNDLLSPDIPPNFSYSLIPENKLPESNRTDTTDKRLAWCRSINDLFIFLKQQKLSFLHYTSSGHKTYSDTPIPSDKRLKKCQAVTNELLSSSLFNSFISSKYFNTEDALKSIRKSFSTDAKPPLIDYSLFPENKLPESEHTDTTDKRLAFCRGMNEYFIFHMQLHLKSLSDISSGRQTFEYSNAPVSTGI